MYSREKEIKDIKVGRPHVVLLGAGASKAAFMDGDKNGIKLPLIDDLADTLDLTRIFEQHGVDASNRNFEDVFTELYESGKNQELINLIEKRVFDYFSKLELPDAPTIYDYLVLSLRDKDVIATFNWDPLLWYAACRNHSAIKPPHIIFLHGNVAMGYCHKCSIKGSVSFRCDRCGNLYEPSKLLYPMSQKNYNLDIAIKGEWKTMQEYVKHAYMFTVFGYGAPKTDVEAIAMLKSAWGNGRNFEQIEFIHRPGSDEDKVIEPWKEFIEPYYHYQTSDDFFKSFIANHPRRTCDAMWAQSMECEFIDNYPAPRDVGLGELQKWFQEFKSYED
jgi:hypothetical protein